MRVWDLDPGYLNRQILLGEHLEIHAIANNRKGYAHRPETLRWKQHRGALCRRHDLGVAEMGLRGYSHRSPALKTGSDLWPSTFLESPGRQFRILAEKYRGRKGPHGRIPLPVNAGQLWAQHKYSVLARDPERYRELGRRVSRMRKGAELDDLAAELVGILREAPTPGRLRNAVDHLWGYVSGLEADSGNPTIAEIAARAMRHRVEYVLHSTALGDLGYWASMV